MLHHEDNRHGITLLEVLISIAVAAIGLLGVAALIPVAAYQAQDGARNDRMSNVGRRSIREIEIRGFCDPGNFNPQTGAFNSRRWIGGIVPAGFNGNPSAFNEPDDVVYQYFPSDPSQHGQFLSRPYCIDPGFVAYAMSGGNVPSTVGAKIPTNSNLINVTPLDGPNWAPPPFQFGHPSLLVPRITLMADPAIPMATSYNQMISNVMGLAQAKETFAFHDDLEFTIPGSKTAAPLQQMLSVGGLAARRLAKSEFSWFMTVTPSSGNWWTVSAVITRDRKLDEASIYGSLLGGVPPAATLPGFWLYALDDPSDVRLAWDGVPAKNIKVGNWLLLSQDPNAMIAGDERLGWYRVTGASEQDVQFVGGATTVFQNLQLQGAKWDTSSAANANSSGYTFVTWMPSVVAVYTREVQISTAP